MEAWQKFWCFWKKQFKKCKGQPKSMRGKIAKTADNRMADNQGFNRGGIERMNRVVDNPALNGRHHEMFGIFMGVILEFAVFYDLEKNPSLTFWLLIHVLSLNFSKCRRAAAPLVTYLKSIFSGQKPWQWLIICGVLLFQSNGNRNITFCFSSPKMWSAKKTK